MKKIALVLMCVFLYAAPVYAGDGATIVLKTGAVIRLNNTGYSQLFDAIQRYNSKKSDNFLAQIKVSEQNYFINVSEIAFMCRDKCTNLEVFYPKTEGEK